MENKIRKIMETLDLTKILAGCPKGTTLYSTIHGNATLAEADNGRNFPIEINFLDEDGEIGTAHFTRDGRYFALKDAECVLFPSKTQRDWSQFKQPQKFQNGDHILWHNNDSNEFLGVFVGYTENEQGVINMFQGDHYCSVDVYIKDLTKVEKFDPKWLRPGDAVLVHNSKHGEWCYALFSHITSMGEKSFVNANSTLWNDCIPYNFETKHIIGTTDDAPEFYDLTEE